MRVDDERCPTCGSRRVEAVGVGMLERAVLASDALGPRFVCADCGQTWPAREGTPWAAPTPRALPPEPEIDEDELEARWAARFGGGDASVEGS